LTENFGRTVDVTKGKKTLNLTQELVLRAYSAVLQSIVVI